MTDEEIKEMEKEAKAYSQGNFYLEQGFLYGFERGFAEGRKEGYEQGKNNERESQCGKKNYENDIARLKKENEQLKKEISILLSCANCPNNKGGYICEKEYNDKCLAQKIEYIKELKEENAELKKEKDLLENDFNLTIETNKKLLSQIEQLQQAYTITVDKSVIREQELETQIKKMKCCHNCKNSIINFTNDSGIKYGCKKLGRKCDDCILNDYYHWELAE